MLIKSVFNEIFWRFNEKIFLSVKNNYLCSKIHIDETTDTADLQP